MTNDAKPFDDCLKYGHLWVNEMEHTPKDSKETKKAICLFCNITFEEWNQKPLNPH